MTGTSNSAPTSLHLAGAEKDEDSLLNPHNINQASIAAIVAQYQAKGGLKAAFNAAAKFKGPSPITITYISDNGGYADLAAAEIKANLQDINRMVSTLGEESPPQILYHDTPSQDWHAAAFDAAQLARYRLDGPGNIIFVNCAPRLAQRGEDSNNQGEKVYVTMLRNGVVVAGVSPHSFAFMRDLVEVGEAEIYEVGIQTKGSQFRSRDFFPWFPGLLAVQLARLVQEDDAWKSGLETAQRKILLSRALTCINTRESLQARDIPDITSNPVIARVDTHGNLKLSIRRGDLPEDLQDKILTIKIKGREFDVILRQHMFDGKTGTRGLAPGSSGAWDDAADPGAAFLELAVMGDSLRQQLDLTDQDLKQGVAVDIRLADQQNAPRRDISLVQEPA
jgi:hypothetical protein